MPLKKTLPLLILLTLLFQGCTSQRVIYDESRKPEAEKKTDAPVADVLTRPAVEQRALTAPILYHLLSGEIAGQRGQFTQAVGHYMEALRLAPDPQVAERAARIAVFARDDKNALKAAQVWVKLAPDNLEAQQVTAALLVRNGQSDAALAHFEKILAETRDTENAERKGFMLIVALLSKERDKQAAMAVMDKLLVSRQQNPSALYAYGHLALLVGELDRAAASINKTLALKPDWIDAHLLQANILIRQGHSAEALKKLAAATEQYPDEIRLRLYYARKLIDEKSMSRRGNSSTRCLSVNLLMRMPCMRWDCWVCRSGSWTRRRPVSRNCLKRVSVSMRRAIIWASFTKSKNSRSRRSIITQR